MLSLLLCTTLGHAASLPVSDIKTETVAISSSSRGKSASDLIAVLRKLGVKSTKSGDQEQFMIAKARFDRTGFGSCNPKGPGDYIATLPVLDADSRETIQTLDLENRDCMANAPLAALDAMMVKFGQGKVGTGDHLGTTTYWISTLNCQHDTRTPAQEPDDCSVMLNSADLVPGWL